MEKCTCDEEEIDPQPCPYDQELDNEDNYCVCCDVCRERCLESI